MLNQEYPGLRLIFWGILLNSQKLFVEWNESDKEMYRLTGKDVEPGQ